MNIAVGTMLLNGTAQVWKQNFNLVNVAVVSDPTGSVMGNSTGTPTLTIVDPRTLQVKEIKIGWGGPGSAPSSLLPLAEANKATSVKTNPAPEVDMDATESCETQCKALHPNGETDYDGMRNCQVCGACYEICDRNVPGYCDEASGADSCSAQATSCAECINSPCARMQNNTTDFVGACADAATACSANTACVSLNNCVANCAAN